jgi:hypothetical protein
MRCETANAAAVAEAAFKNFLRELCAILTPRIAKMIAGK